MNRKQLMWSDFLAPVRWLAQELHARFPVWGEGWKLGARQEAATIIQVRSDRDFDKGRRSEVVKK